MPPLPSKPKRSPERLRAERFGRRAETLAALYLRAKLYRILKTRYKTPVGEIDLIAERFGVTVFIEVKTRMRRAAEAEALASVNQSRILRAASYFVMRHPDRANAEMRFDVLFLTPGRWPSHWRNAFQG